MTFEKTLIKVDRFGTKTYSSQRRCVRCGGAGGHNMWPGYTCFRCGGSGIDPSPELVKEYTPDAEHSSTLSMNAEELKSTLNF